MAASVAGSSTDKTAMILLPFLFFFPFFLFFHMQLLIAGVPGVQVAPAAHCQGSRGVPASATIKATDMGLQDTHIVPRPQLGSCWLQALRLMSRLHVGLS